MPGLQLSTLDTVALAIFAVAWLAYEPLVKAALGRRHMINLDMAEVWLDD